MRSWARKDLEKFPPPQKKSRRRLWSWDGKTQKKFSPHTPLGIKKEEEKEGEDNFECVKKMKGKYGYGDSQWGPRNYCDWAEYIGGGRNIGSVWIELILLKLKTKNWKYCSKIIFKCVNNTVRHIFNEKIAEKWSLWVHEQCTDALFTEDLVNNYD